MAHKPRRATGIRKAAVVRATSAPVTGWPKATVTVDPVRIFPGWDTRPFRDLAWSHPVVCRPGRDYGALPEAAEAAEAAIVGTCRRGHLYRRTAGGKRRCPTCDRITQARRRAKLRAEVDAARKAWHR